MWSEHGSAYTLTNATQSLGCDQNMVLHTALLMQQKSLGWIRPWFCIQLKSLDMIRTWFCIHPYQCRSKPWMWSEHSSAYSLTNAAQSLGSVQKNYSAFSLTNAFQNLGCDQNMVQHSALLMHLKTLDVIRTWFCIQPYQCSSQPWMWSEHGYPLSLTNAGHNIWVKTWFCIQPY